MIFRFGGVNSNILYLIDAATALQWYEKFTEVDEVIPVSAKYGHGVEDVKEWILSKLPFGPPYYPKVLLKRTLSPLLLYTRACG